MDHIRAMFGYALVEGCSLSAASNALGYSKDDLSEAVNYRFAVCDLGHDYITDYQESISEGMRRLSEAS